MLLWQPVAGGQGSSYVCPLVECANSIPLVEGVGGKVRITGILPEPHVEGSPPLFDGVNGVKLAKRMFKLGKN